jgi:uncharacterized protein YabN with tetrapyrrole methylase and pyrophosphatase domain
VVGTGIRAVGQVTLEARHRIETAGKLLYLLADPITTRWVRDLNASAESLHDLYEPGGARRAAYTAMVERVLGWVRQDLAVTVAFYGHPGVFVAPGHEAVRAAREEGFRAEMLPGVSAEDCLFADLGIDPAAGCQSYEATDFLLHGRRIDTSAALVLWQAGVVGDLRYRQGPAGDGLRVLTDHLLGLYPGDHRVWVYEAATLPVLRSRAVRVPLGELAGTELSPMSTLYLPPARPAAPDPDMARRLGITITPDG